MILNDIANVVDCEHKTAPTEKTGYPSIRTPNIGRGRLILEGVNRVSKKTYEQWARRAIPQTHDLILAREAPVGNVAIIPNGLKVCLGQRTVLIQPDRKNVNPHYLTYLLLGNEIQGRFKSVSTGATVAHLNVRDIRDLPLPELPPLETQRKIAAILSAYDDLIENNLRRIKILEELAQRLYREWFVHFRFPGHERVPLVDSSLGKIPQGWEVAALEDVCSRITDGSHSSPKSVDDGFPMASVKDMHDWGFNVDNCRRISAEDFENLVRNDCKPLKDDLLIAKDGSYLKHAFVVEKETDLVVLSSIAILRPNGRFLPHLLAMYLKDPQVKSRLAGFVSGAALPRIVLKDFRTFEVLVPLDNIQKLWRYTVQPMISLGCRLHDKNKNLRQTRNLLLPRLISGKLDVSDMEVVLA